MPFSTKKMKKCHFHHISLLIIPVTICNKTVSLFFNQHQHCINEKQQNKNIFCVLKYLRYYSAANASRMVFVIYIYDNMTWLYVYNATFSNKSEVCFCLLMFDLKNDNIYILECIHSDLARCIIIFIIISTPCRLKETFWYHTICSIFKVSVFLL